MRYFRVVYERREVREVWVETDDKGNEDVAVQMFWDNFDYYDSESDDRYADGGTEVLDVDEIDENGDEI